MNDKNEQSLLGNFELGVETRRSPWSRAYASRKSQGCCTVWQEGTLGNGRNARTEQNGDDVLGLLQENATAT